MNERHETKKEAREGRMNEWHETNKEAREGSMRTEKLELLCCFFCES